MGTAFERAINTDEENRTMTNAMVTIRAIHFTLPTDLKKAKVSKKKK